jgi:hypothetical protein
MSNLGTGEATPRGHDIGAPSVFHLSIPSVERLLSSYEARALIAEFGRPDVTAAVRSILAEVRTELVSADPSNVLTERELMGRVSDRLEALSCSS